MNILHRNVKPGLPALVCAAGLVVSSALWAAPGERGPVSIEQAQARAEARFAQLDSNGDSVVSLAEFEAAKPMGMPRRPGGHGGPGRDLPGMHHKGKSHGQGKHGAAMRAAIDAELFDIIDRNADGQISREEHAAANQPANRRLARQRAVFKRLDKDGSGTLSRAEMPDPAKRLSAADSDGDGFVTREEMRAHRQARRQQQAG